MPAINIDKFLGLAPRINPKRLPPGVASKAVDVDLDNEVVRPWRDGLEVHEAQHDILSFARVGCCWLTWDRCVDVVTRFTPACSYVILTGAADYPQIATADDACAGIWCRLGVPCPDAAPIMQPQGAVVDDRKLTYRAYRYTFVNKYGQEGGGSAPSQVANCNDGQSVLVTGFSAPSAEWCVEKIRLYRLGTGFETGLENSNPQNTEYFFVDEFPVGTLSYTDSIPDLELGGDAGPDVFVNDETVPPPADLHSIVNLENGRLAGISGGQIWMSDPNLPHAWLLRYVKATFDPPVALAAIASQLYVGTTGRPYVVDGRNDCQGDGCQAVLRTRVPLPCVSKRSMVADSGVVYYASKAGLACATGTSVRLISQTHLSARDWQRLHPNRMIAAWREGYYHAYSDNAGIRFRGPEGEFGNPQDIAYTNLSERPDAVWRAETGELYYAIGRKIYLWNGGARFKPYTWTTTPLNFPRRDNLTAVALDRGVSGNVEFTMTTDYGDIIKRLVNTEKPFRLPGLGNAKFVQFTLRGTAEVQQITAGSSLAERIRAEQIRATS